MTGVRLRLSFGRISQRKVWETTTLIFFSSISLPIWAKLIAVRLRLKRGPANPIFVQLRLIHAPNKAHQNSPFLHDG